MTASTPKSAMAYSRFLLAGAALLAIVSVGRTLLSRDDAPAPAAVATDAGASEAETLIAQLRARLAEEPGNAEGWRLLGWATFSTGRYAEAVKAYAEAARLDPEKAEHWSALGESTVLAGQGGVTADAMTAFRKALALDPKDARARFFMGAAQAEAGQPRAALDSWFALLADAPANAPWTASVRQRITDLSKREGIDVSARLANLPTPAASGPTPEQMQAAASMTPAEQQAMAKSMVESLAARLKADPRDANGWIMLMRSRKMLGDDAGAKQALAEARAAFAGDQQQIARFDEFYQSLGIR